MRSKLASVALTLSCSAAFLATAVPLSLAGQTGNQTSPAREPAVTRESLAGTYDGGQMEVAAQLLLSRDGHFEYELAYGALDEEAKGTWELRDGAVFLTTIPAVVPPRFVVVSDKPDPSGGLWIKLTKPLMEGARQRIYLIYGPHQEPDMVELPDDGRVRIAANHRPVAFLPEIPVYPVLTKAIPITAGGHRFLLRFEPNDIGKADFRPQRLDIDDGVLVMPRRDLQLMLRFRHAPPPS